jgi:hypothetical protein
MTRLGRKPGEMRRGTCPRCHQDDLAVRRDGTPVPHGPRANRCGPDFAAGWTRPDPKPALVNLDLGPAGRVQVTPILAALVGAGHNSIRDHRTVIESIRDAESNHQTPAAERLPVQPRERQRGGRS